jgi:hypothetical protein
MKRAALTAFLTLTTVALALPAGAKGVSEATITGPGIEEPIVLGVGGEESRRIETLISAIAFWDLTYTYPDSPHRPPISDEPPTANLGPEFTVRVGHIGPGGTAYVDVLVYPDAEGGPLVHVEPDVKVEEMQEVTSGGWYVSDADLAALFEEYGADMNEAKVASGPPLAVPLPGPSVEAPGETLPLWLPIAAVIVFSLIVGQVIRIRMRDGLA